MTDTKTQPDLPSKPCGGCGATENSQRCFGCLHDFGTPESAWVRNIARTPETQPDDAMVEIVARAICREDWSNTTFADWRFDEDGSLREIYLCQARAAIAAARPAIEAQHLLSVAEMMATVVENWPNPKKLETAIALIGKTLDAMVSVETCKAREAQARAEERAVVLAMLPEAIMSQVFGLAQPDRGDVFSWLDDHKHQIVAGALLAIEQSQHTGEK